MPRQISNECIACGAISMGAEHYEVNAAECIDCGACDAQCPVGAISEK